LLLLSDELEKLQKSVRDEDENVNEEVAGREENECRAVAEQRRRQMFEELGNVCKQRSNKNQSSSVTGANSLDFLINRYTKLMLSKHSN
jgi:hypothetical protein